MNYALTTRKAALTAAQAAMKGIPPRASRSSIYSSPEAKRRTGVMVSVCKAGLSIAGHFVPAEVPDGLHGYQVAVDGHLLCDLLKRMAGELLMLSQVEGVWVLESAGFRVELVGWDVRLPDPAPVTVPEMVETGPELVRTPPAKVCTVPPLPPKTKKRPTKWHPNTTMKSFYTAQTWSL